MANPQSASVPNDDASNRVKGSRWLVVSYFSNVDGMACSAHVDDRIARLQERGVEVVLLTSVCAQPKPAKSGATLRVRSIAPSGIRFELRHWVRQHGNSLWLKLLSMVLFLPLLPFYVLEKLLIPLDSQWSWFLSAVRAGRRLAREYQPQLIYSSGGAASAHLAAAMIARNLKIGWIAELQDPLIYDPWPRSRWAWRLYAAIEGLICRRADAIIFLTEAAVTRAAERHPRVRREKFHVIRPGAEPRLFGASKYKKGPVCRFAHFGSLAGTRNLNSFLEALQAVLSKSPKWQQILRIELYGTMDRPCCRAVELFPFPAVISIAGRVSRREALELMSEVDVLLLIQNADNLSSETIPSKVYEYLLAGRPILGLLSGNPELQSMLESHGHTAVPVNSVQQIRQAIVAIVERWQRDEERPVGASQYTVAAAVDQLEDIAAKVARQNQP